MKTQLYERAVVIVIVC